MRVWPLGPGAALAERGWRLPSSCSQPHEGPQASHSSSAVRGLFGMAKCAVSSSFAVLGARGFCSMRDTLGMGLILTSDLELPILSCCLSSDARPCSFPCSHAGCGQELPPKDRLTWRSSADVRKLQTVEQGCCSRRGGRAGSHSCQAEQQMPRGGEGSPQAAFGV